MAIRRFTWLVGLPYRSPNCWTRFIGHWIPSSQWVTLPVLQVSPCSLPNPFELGTLRLQPAQEPALQRLQTRLQLASTPSWSSFNDESFEASAVQAGERLGTSGKRRPYCTKPTRKPNMDTVVFLSKQVRSITRSTRLLLCVINKYGQMWVSQVFAGCHTKPAAVLLYVVGLYRFNSCFSNQMLTRFRCHTSHITGIWVLYGTGVCMF